MMDGLSDEYYMRLALQLAGGALGQTGINPIVGCVVVKAGAIIGMGAHLQRGMPHAEVHALRMAGDQAIGSTVYVTLEPCSIYGRTPPCCDLLITEKVARVVIACLDPNPKVAGTGAAKLRSYEIAVEVGLLQQEAQAMNEKYNKYIVNRLPFVSLKTASTLDGKIASKTGDSKWITNELSRTFVHTLRHQHQAILVGIETVIKDDPQLTTRLSVQGLDPIRILIDSQLRTPPQSKILSETTGRTIIITTEQASTDQAERLKQQGAEIWIAGAGPQVDLVLAMRMIGDQEISSILLEGGGRLNGAMLEQQLIDKCYLFFAPKIIGGDSAPGNFSFSGFASMSEAITIDKVSYETFGQDLCIIGYPRYL